MYIFAKRIHAHSVHERYELELLIRYPKHVV